MRRLGSRNRERIAAQAPARGPRGPRGPRGWRRTGPAGLETRPKPRQQAERRRTAPRALIATYRGWAPRRRQRSAARRCGPVARLPRPQRASEASIAERRESWWCCHWGPPVPPPACAAAARIRVRLITARHRLGPAEYRDRASPPASHRDASRRARVTSP